MVEIPDSLRSMFSATIQERDGRHVIEVPPGEVENGAVAPGETYRLAILDPAAEAGTPEESAASSADDGADPDRAKGVPEPPVDEGDVREVSIETVGDQGDGIAKVERGYVVIVPGARPGDRPTIEIDRVQRNVAFASVLDDQSGPR